VDIDPEENDLCHPRDAMALADLALHEYRPLLRELGALMVRPAT
jgi:hypothetical protein